MVPGDNNRKSDMAVCFQDVDFGWPNASHPVFRSLEFFISPGEHVFLQGSSGSGKSTLLSLLSGILQPDSGQINVLGQSLTSIKPSLRDQFRADHIGYVFQLFNLVPYLNVVENIALALRFSPRRRNRLEHEGTDLLKESHRLLEALDLEASRIIYQPVTALSVGQQQRVASVRALIGGPEILVADEPTSALDKDTRHAFLDLLFQECRHRSITVIFVSHDQDLASEFDRTIHIDDLAKGCWQ